MELRALMIAASDMLLCRSGQPFKVALPIAKASRRKLMLGAKTTTA